MRIKNNIKFFFGFFFFIFSLLAISSKLLGIHGRYDLPPHNYEPLTWGETWQFLPQFFFASLTITVFITILHYQAKKNEEWRINGARKRIAERERQEKEKESANDDERQEQNIIRSHEEKEPK